MQRRFFASGMVMACALDSAPLAAQPLAWDKIAGPDGRYRLKMPRGYRYLTVPAHGGTLHSYVFVLPDKLTLELLDVTFASPQPNVPTAPAALQSALEQIQGGMQKSWPGSTVLEARPVTLGALTGREFVLAARGDRVVTVRVYVTPTVVYTQIAVCPAAERSNAAIAEFMESFRLA
ncbi:MAG: hypothetical protein AB7U95_12655 [Reyranella sp.]